MPVTLKRALRPLPFWTAVTTIIYDVAVAFAVAAIGRI
jgi:hypothetical protein